MDPIPQEEQAFPCCKGDQICLSMASKRLLLLRVRLQPKIRLYFSLLQDLPEACGIYKFQLLKCECLCIADAPQWMPMPVCLYILVIPSSLNVSL